MSKIEYVHHNGARVGYRDDGAGKPLILVHGTGGDGEANFEGLLPHLSRRRLLRPDYAGSGLTEDPTEVLTLDHLVQQVIAAADHAGIDRFDLAGFSLGSAVAVRLAALHSGRVDRLVLIGGFVHASDPRSRLQFGLWADLARRDPATLARLMMLTGFSRAFLAGVADMEAVVSDMVSGGNWEGVALQAELDLRVDVSPDLSLIRAPTLVIGNRCDQMVDPAASTTLAAGIAGATLAWLEGPHLALMERPEAAAELLLRHLAD
ncbi:alpha/beta fold hydrolase [Cereibacter sphaeroides]|uniref:alpha/beta fold hydrolase n=1 Tax=Cereibacter sphaeroides TaxID=1063 RepID=UPI000E5BF3C8|nr:alpha/beta hydrolase [Cereibacter sphaeroides]RIA00603.1 alpha/beta fold hydrolase [Cereibacter sphaeroides]